MAIFYALRPATQNTLIKIVLQLRQTSKKFCKNL